MLKAFPLSYKEAVDWGWAEFAPFAQELLAREITAENLSGWMADQSQFLTLIHELNGRLAIAVDQNNEDRPARERLNRFREEVWSRTHHLTNQLENKLIATGRTPPGYEIQLECIRNQLAIFHPENVNLETEEKACRDQYEAIYRNMKVEVNGQQHNIFDVLRMLHIEPDRAKREYIYRHVLSVRTAGQEAFDTLWKKLFALRQQIARNAGVSDYRAYMWQKLNRLDYTPHDVIAFCTAIENVVVPLVAELCQQQAVALGLDSLKPWDQTVEVQTGRPLKPYQDTADWLQKSRQAFDQISPPFAAHFDTMQAEGLLDLESRPHKSPWNYAERLPASNRAFIFINGRGGNGDLFMLFHEFGHAVQLMEMSNLPYLRQKMVPDEISEVASTTMELLAGDHLHIFYPPDQTRIVRYNHLAGLLWRWPFAAMVALFQHWAYTHPEQGADPAACDQYWLDLCGRFMAGIDYTGFEDDLRLQWREIFQVFNFPFYFIEYAFAQLGAVQIWNNYRRDPDGAINQFRQAISRGHTVSVPEFYTRAGAKFTFDTESLKQTMAMIQQELLDEGLRWTL